MKTYSEQRQDILFRAARELRKIAASVLDDVLTPAELQSETTPNWAKSIAYTTARMAQELEAKGYEQTIASPRAETANFKSHQAYSRAILGFEDRILAAGGTLPNWKPEEVS